MPNTGKILAVFLRKLTKFSHWPHNALLPKILLSSRSRVYSGGRAFWQAWQDYTCKASLMLTIDG